MSDPLYKQVLDDLREVNPVLSDDDKLLAKVARIICRIDCGTCRECVPSSRHFEVAQRVVAAVRENAS